jgi:CheY-like chemotaxis protein
MANVLVIEDDVPMNNIMVGTLTDDGHQVMSAFDGLEAVQAFRDGNFDLVITDVRLPGIDGVETLSKLKEMSPSVRTMIMTGYTSSDTPIRAIRLEVDDYLFKPFSLRYFLGSVNRVLDQEGRAKAKQALIQRLFHVFGTPREKQFVGLKKDRKEAFRGLFVGTRSGFLSRLGASELYLQLESLEERFRALLNIEDPAPTKIEEMQRLYRALLERLAGGEFGMGPTIAGFGDDLPREQLTALFEAIKAADVGLDDVQYAPLLRTTPDDQLESLTQLLELKRRLWPVLVR